VSAIEQLIDKLLESADILDRIALLNFNGDETAVAAYLSLDVKVYFIINGSVCDPSDKGDKLRSVITKIPIDRLLLGTDSPFSTPQVSCKFGLSNNKEHS
jgi:Tat protein secretion system quality control protein TatD with DNase activity